VQAAPEGGHEKAGATLTGGQDHKPMKAAGEGAQEGGGSPDSDGDDQREGVEACEAVGDVCCLI
jgi:hypothetical protein